jgi:hypothetical protein
VVAEARADVGFGEDRQAVAGSSDAALLFGGERVEIGVQCLGVVIVEAAGESFEASGVEQGNEGGEREGLVCRAEAPDGVGDVALGLALVVRFGVGLTGEGLVGDL